MTTSSNLLRDCEKLWWHRLLAVESMGGFAWRTKRHRDTICSRLGWSEVNGPEAAQLVIPEMLDELGMEPTDYNVQALAWATRSSWEVYICLLYAGVENYRSISGKHSAVAHQPLVNFLESCPGLEDKLMRSAPALTCGFAPPQNSLHVFIAVAPRFLSVRKSNGDVSEGCFRRSGR